MRDLWFRLGSLLWWRPHRGRLVLLRPMVLSSGLVLPAYFSAKMGMSPRVLFRGAWLPALLSAEAGVVAVFLWRRIAATELARTHHGYRRSGCFNDSQHLATQS